MPESAQPNYKNLLLSLKDYDAIVRPIEQSGHADPDKVARQDIMAAEKAWEDSRGNVVKTALTLDKTYAQTAGFLSNKAVGIISKDDPRTLTQTIKKAPMPEYQSPSSLMDLENKAMRSIGNGEAEKGLGMLSQASQGTDKLIEDRVKTRQVQSEAESFTPPKKPTKSPSKKEDFDAER